MVLLVGCAVLAVAGLTTWLLKPSGLASTQMRRSPYRNVEPLTESSSIITSDRKSSAFAESNPHQRSASCVTVQRLSASSSFDILVCLGRGLRGALVAGTSDATVVERDVALLP
jgi:hypothetical protein